MRVSKAIPIAAAIAMAFTQWSAFADGLAYKYPVVVPEQPAAKAATVTPGSVGNQSAVSSSVVVPPAKPIGPYSVWDAATANISTGASPASAAPAAAAVGAGAAAVQTPVASQPEKKGITQWMVSRYEPLSERDSAEAVPDLNRRGHGAGK